VTSAPFRKHRQSSNYRLLGLVGRGQFGQVYCAIHRKTGRLMALKNLNRDRLPTNRFLRELRFLLSLEHPHIANCHALEQSATGRQLVLDYCEGGTLRDILEQESQLTLAEILTLVTEILAALEHAHSHGIVHCDIKPENILLSLTPDSWQVKVSDFGIARLSQELKGDRSGATGSPAYMAPERFYHQYAASSDIYAVGVVLYEMLVGDRPFSGSHNQLMVAHLNHAVKIPDTLPQSMREVLHKALEKLMARRFHSAADMQTAIVSARQALTAGELREPFPKPVAAVPVSRFQPQQAMPLDAPCRQLVIAATASAMMPQVLTMTDNTVYGWPLTATLPLEQQRPSQRWSFADPVQRLIKTVRGMIAATETALYYLSANALPQPLAHFPEPIRVLPGGDRWLCAQSLAQPEQFWLVDTLAKVPPTPRSFATAPSPGRLQGLLLDDRHLVLAEVDNPKTLLRVMTRWGTRLGGLTLRTPLRQLLPSRKANYCLAQAGTHGHDLLTIHLKPFRVMRCRLGAAADWIGELAIGYVTVSAAGHLRVVNFHGQLIGQVDYLPSPTAIAFQPPYHVWLATHQNQLPHLHCIDIRNLDLDIVF